MAGYHAALPTLARDPAGNWGRRAPVSVSHDDGRFTLAARPMPARRAIAPALPASTAPQPLPPAGPTLLERRDAPIPRPEPEQPTHVPGASESAAPALPEQGIRVGPALGPGTAPAPVAARPEVPGSTLPVLSQSGDTDVAMSESELMAELEAIVKGQSVYDPAQKKTVRRDALVDSGRAASASSPTPAPAAAAEDAQAIFDRIAQSMQHAGAYDLGTVELENRFADFDRMAELKSRAGQRPGPPVGPTPLPQRANGEETDGPSRLDSDEFLDDLDHIRRGQPGGVAPQGVPVARPQSVPGHMAQPLYDAGEHVLPGADLFVDQLLLGKPPTVLFSYGDLIAMGDLFPTPMAMIEADPKQLQALKERLRESAQFYAGRGGRDIGDDEWDRLTGGSYSDLAEENYEHYAPNELFGEDRLVAAASRHGDHRSQWQRYHRQAIEQAERESLDPANANRSYVPTRALAINAFADHFLTDAFAAGHLLNKAAFLEKFKSRFFDSSGDLLGIAKDFFDKVAAKAWHGDLARGFVKLETYDKYDSWWNVFGWHPDIKNADRFATVLKGIAEKEPEKVGNVALKAVHDVLNKTGIDVSNEDGSAWRLTGDGHLTPTTLAIMKVAVKQSVANITGQELNMSNLDFDKFFHRVWRYVPIPDSASSARIVALVDEYTNPRSVTLIDAAADIIYRKSALLIQALIRRKALRPT